MTNTSQTRTQKEWTTRVKVDENAVGGSFSVLIFLGTVPEPDRWRDTPSYVGSVSAYTGGYGSYGSYGSGGPAGTTNLIEGFVYLNENLASQLGSRKFDPETVVPYLTRNLDWRIEKVSKMPVLLPCHLTTHNRQMGRQFPWRSYLPWR
jgi:tyrosinase